MNLGWSQRRTYGQAENVMLLQPSGIKKKKGDEEKAHPVSSACTCAVQIQQGRTLGIYFKCDLMSCLNLVLNVST